MSELYFSYIVVVIAFVFRNDKPHSSQVLSEFIFVDIISVKYSLGRLKARWSGLMLMGSIPAGKRCLLHQDAGRSLSASQNLSPTVYKAASHWTIPLFYSSLLSGLLKGLAAVQFHGFRVAEKHLSGCLTFSPISWLLNLLGNISLSLLHRDTQFVATVTIPSEQKIHLPCVVQVIRTVAAYHSCKVVWVMILNMKWFLVDSALGLWIM